MAIKKTVCFIMTCLAIYLRINDKCMQRRNIPVAKDREIHIMYEYIKCSRYINNIMT